MLVLSKSKSKIKSKTKFKSNDTNETIVYSQSLKFNLKLQRTVILIIKYKLQIILN